MSVQVVFCGEVLKANRTLARVVRRDLGALGAFNPAFNTPEHAEIT